jgi:hypothetical protein
MPIGVLGQGLTPFPQVETGPGHQTVVRSVRQANQVGRGSLVLGVFEEPDENVRVVFHVVSGELDALLELGPPGMRA